MVLENKIFIQVIKKLHSDRLNFNALIKIIEDNNIGIKFSRIKFNIGGYSKMNEIVINEDYGTDSKLFYIILHEIAHFKRFKKTGELASAKAHRELFLTRNIQPVIIEERLADRYAAFVYNKLNNEIVRYYMQNIYTDTEVLNYKNRFEQSLKMGDEDLYTHIKKIESFILP